MIIKHQDFRDFLNLGGEPGWYIERAVRDQGREVGDRGQETHHERDQESHGRD